MQLLKKGSFNILKSHPSVAGPPEQITVPIISATLPTGQLVSSTDVIIALMGPTGSGKTTFLNVATGSTQAVGTDLSSCTTEIVPITIPLPSDPTRNLILVDTPGFDNPQFSDMKVMQMVSEWLKKTFEQKILLSGILYFHKISDNRVAGTPLANLRIFEELCGRNAFANVVLVTTMWDEVDESVGQSRQHALCNKFWKKMVQGHSTTRPFKGTPESANSVLEHFLSAPTQRRLLLQDEMVNQGLMLSRTSAGIALCLKLGEVEEQQLLMIQRIEHDLRSDLDPKSVQSLEDDHKKLEKKAEEFLSEISLFKAPLTSLVSDILRSPFAHHSRLSASLLRRYIHHSKLSLETMNDIRKRIRNNEEDRDLVVFVLGPTGSGKSSFINAVVGKTAVVVKESEDGALESVTDKLQTVLHPNIDGSGKQGPRICFVDVPAFNHTAQAVQDALPSQIRSWLEINVMGKTVDSAIVYMNSLSSSRLNEPFSVHLEGFLDICKEKDHTPTMALLLQTDVPSETLANEADEPFNASVERFKIRPAPMSIRFSGDCRPDGPGKGTYPQSCRNVVTQLAGLVAAGRK